MYEEVKLKAGETNDVRGGRAAFVQPCTPRVSSSAFVNFIFKYILHVSSKTKIGVKRNAAHVHGPILPTYRWRHAIRMLDRSTYDCK